MIPLGNARSIELDEVGLIVSFDWLRTVNFGNLQHLRFGYSVHFEKSADAFFESQPNLKTLYCGRENRLITWLESIVKHSTNIENISGIRGEPYDHRDSPRFQIVHGSDPVVKASLPKLNKLKTLRIRVAGHDLLFEILNCISKHNVLSTLKIQFNASSFGRFSGRSTELSIANFTMLTHLHINTKICAFAFFPDIFDEFIRIGLPHMPNVKKFIVEGNNMHFEPKISQNSVVQIVEMLEHLCVLDIVGFDAVEDDPFKPFYMDLVKARSQQNQNTLPLVVHCYCAERYRAQLEDEYDDEVVKIDDKY